MIFDWQSCKNIKFRVWLSSCQSNLMCQWPNKFSSNSIISIECQCDRHRCWATIFQLFTHWHLFSSANTENPIFIKMKLSKIAYHSNSSIISVKYTSNFMTLPSSHNFKYEITFKSNNLYLFVIQLTLLRLDRTNVKKEPMIGIKRSNACRWLRHFVANPKSICVDFTDGNL